MSGAAGVAGIDHVQIAMPPGAEDLCRRFNIVGAGMTEIEEPPMLAAGGGPWLCAEAQQPHLGVEAELRPARKAHPALAVADLEALARQLEASGALVTWDDAVPGRFDCSDPPGNRLEVLQSPRTQTPPLE